MAAGTLLAFALGVVASCRVDKLVSPPVEGVLMPSMAAVVDSAAVGSAALRISKIALATSRPGRLSWRADRAQSSAWLGMVHTTGNAPDTLELQLNPSGLAFGLYRDTIVLSTNNSEAPPLRIPIDFAVHPCRITMVPEDTLVNGPLDTSECGSSRVPGMFARLFEFAANAGDSVTIELQATGFDAQLILDTAASATGVPPLASATSCRGATGDPCLTYFRLPSTRHYFVEINGASPAAVGTFVLLVAAPSPPRVPASPQQFRSDSTTVVAIGETVLNQTLVFRATISDPDVVDTVRLEMELRGVGVAFTGTPTHTSTKVANGALATIVAPVGDDSSFHWRVRAADQTGRKGPWLSFGANAESAADFTTSVPQAPNAPSTMAQLRGSDRAPIPIGGSSSVGSVVFRATVTDPDPGDSLRLEIEVRPLGTAFTNTPTLQSTQVPRDSMAEATLSGLSDGTSYHWQARTVDKTNRAGPWTSFGGNLETNADFFIAVPATQLVFSAQPTNATAGAAISPAIQVMALDFEGHAAVSFTDTVTIAIGTNPGSGTPSGTLKVKAVLGVATFSNVSINRVGTGYTLTATAPSLPGVTATSSAFNITPASASQLAFTVQPTNVTSAAAISPAVRVTARDAQGNTATAFTGNITIALGTNPSSGTITGTLTAAAAAGVATFSNLHIDKAGTGYTLSASATALASGTSAAFNVTPAAASELVFTVQPTTADAGVAITPPIQITARDPAGNTATGFTAPVTLAIAANPGSGALAGTATVAAASGIAAFPGLSIDKIGAGYTLAATSPGLVPDTSVAFTITSAAASRLVFSVQPSNVTAGVTFAPAVRISVQDGLGNPVTTFTGTITVALGTNPGGGTLAGTLSLTAVAGAATFSDISVNKSGAGYTLQATATGLTGITSAAFTVAPATATKLAFTVQPTSSTAGASITPAMEVTARDAFDNVATAYSGNITLAIGTNPGSSTLSGTATVAASLGVASFPGVSLNKSGTAYTLTAAAAGLTGATSAAFNITPGAASQLAFTTQPSNAVSAVNITPAVRVTARDAFGNTATGFSGNITVAIGTNPGGGTLSGSTAATPSSGVATYSNLNIDKVGTGYTLTASASGLTGATSATFNITPGAPTKLAFTVQPTDEGAGSIITPAIQVTARDAQDNAATSFTGSVTVAIGANPGSGTLSGTLTMTAVSGVATFGTLSINKTGVGYTLNATSASLPGFTAISSTFNITAAPATLLIFTGQPSNVVAGASITPAVQITAKDSLGNTATGFTGNVTVAIAANPSGGGIISGTTTVAAVAGVATFSNLSINLVGTGYTLSASAAGAGTTASVAFNVVPGTATQLAFTVQPSNASAGVAIAPPMQITARDAQGNVATGFAGSVTLAIGTNPSGGTIGGTTTLTAANGVVSFGNVNINLSGTGYTIVASATGVSNATSAPFNITAGGATQLAFTVQPTNAAAAANITPAIQVTARDAQGNTASGFTGTISLAFLSNPGSGTLTGGGAVAAVAGVATFPAVSINKTGNGYQLAATAAGLTDGASAAFNITPAPPTKLVFTVHPNDATAGAAIAPPVQVTAFDAQDNIATQYTGSVIVALGTNPAGATLAGTLTRAAVAGVATFDNLAVDKATTGYRLTANATGLTGATSAAFSITPGTATQLGFTVQPPASATAGAPITPNVKVSALDAQGNVAPTYVGSVTLTLSNPRGAILSGGGPLTMTDGSATFAFLSVDSVNTGYTLQAASGSLQGVVSTPFNITPAAASVLVYVVQPTTTTAAASITPPMQVRALDAFGNTATGFTGTVTLTIGNNPGTGTLSGTTARAASAGTASFAGLSIDKSGTGYTLNANATGVTGVTSAAFNINPGAATQLAFSVQPTNTVSATPITPAVQVQARDAQGNVATSFTGNITVAIGTNPPGTGVLSGTLTVPATAGVASFSNLSINLTGVGYTLSATTTGLTTGTSAAFNITPGTASVLVFTVQPTSATAGVAISPAVQVTARDAQGNTATGFTSNVTIAIGSNPGGGTLSGTPTVAAVAGVATFANLRINRTGTGYTLTATDAGPVTGTSAAFNISPAPASVLAFTVQPTTTIAGVAMTPAVQVTARDSVGNTATSFVGTITIAIGTNPGGGTLTGTPAVAAVAGVANFANLRINRTGTGYTFTANATGLTGTTSTAFNIAHAPASVLVFTQQPTNATAGAAITPAVQVTARDSVGNTATAFAGNVTVAIGTNPGGGTLTGGGPVAAVAGVATFPALSINNSGTGYTLTANATGLAAATSAAFNIGAGAATQLVFTVQPSNATAGVANAPAVQVTARDGQGNTATGFTGVVTIAIGANPGGGTLSGTPAVAAVAGVATFSNLRINRSGTGYTLSASATGAGTAASAAFNITPAPAVALVFSAQPSNTTAGATITPAVQVTAQDSVGNTATSFTGSITVAIGSNPGVGTLSGTASIIATAGVASFANLSINKTGTGYTLTAAAGGLTGATSGAFNITPGVAAQLAFTVQPSNTVAGAAITPAVQVTARDAQGNTATAFAGNMTVAIGANPSGGTLSGTATITPVAGEATFSNLSINKTGTGYTLTATAVGLTGVTATSTTFNILPGVAATLVFTVQPSDEAAGSAITPPVQVTARDNQGNTATGFAGTITVAIGANPAGGTLAGTAAVAASAGVATFGNLSINKSGTGYTLTAAAAGVTGATSTAFNIVAAPATVLAFTGQPSNVTAGAAISPPVVVTARDSLGNVAASFTGNVTIAIGNNPSGGALLGTSTTTVAAVAGIATFSNLALNLVGTGYTLTASATGAGTASSAPFNVLPGNATQLAFTVQPSSATAGVAIAPAIQVTARDAFGNTATGFAASVTLAIGTNPGGGTLGGSPTLTASNGVVSFGNVNVNRTGTGYTLTASSNGVSTATSTTFNITPGAAVALAFAVGPSNTAAAANMTPAIQVAARDDQGNTATSFTGTISLAIISNPGGGTLTGGGAVTAVAGVATFPSVSINKTGFGYQLSATTTGLVAATSATFNITPGTPTQLVFTIHPNDAQASVAISPPIEVTARDAQGNTATQFTGNVTMSIGTNPNGGTLAGTTVRAAVAGVATFNDLNINRAGGGYRLAANAAGMTAATSAAFSITPGTATRLAFTVQPSTQQAGAAMTPTVRVSAVDAQGNQDPTYVGNVTLTLTTPAGATLSGGGPVAVTDGAALFPFLSVNKTGTGYTLQAVSGVLTGTTSTAFDITPSAASVLVFTVQPSSATAATIITPAIQVVVRDAFGNTATGFTGNVTLAIGANPGGGTLSGTATVAAVSGLATFSTLSINKTGTGYTLVASAPGVATGATSNAFNITPGAATQLAFSVQPVNTVAATAITPAVQVQARDAQGNTATSFTGNITVAIGTNPSGGALSGTTTVAAAAGVANFGNLSINLSGTGYTLSATATGLTTGTSAAFNITSGAATALVFSVQPTTTVAGAAITPAVQVTARDAQGNTATGFTGNVSMAIVANPGTGTLSGTTTVAAVAGVATFSNLHINRTGNGYTIQPVATGLTSPISSAFNITPAPASVLVFTVQPSSATAGIAISPAIQVTARDSVGNVATSFTGGINIAIGSNPGGATLAGTATVAATAGVANFADLRLNRTGTGYTLVATATGVTGVTSNTFNITPAPASVLVFTVQPASASAGTPSITAQVTARDSVGNTATAFTGNITLAIGTNPSGGTLSGTNVLAATAGVANFSALSINLTGTGYTLVATATGLTGATSTAFNIVASGATQLVFTVQPVSTTAGVAITPAVQVTARDAQGNTATAFTGNVTIAIGANPGTSTLSGTSTVAAISGVATFSNLRLNHTGTGYTLVASATGLTSGTSSAFNITPAPGVTLVFTTQPSDELAGATITPAVQVTARDSLGNTATSFTASVTVAIGSNPSGGTLSGTASLAAVAGVATFADLSINKTGVGYTLTAAATGLTGATSTSFNIGSGAATTLVFTSQPTSVTAGVVIAPSVQVTARDAQGNTATAFTGNVTIAIANNPGGSTLTGSPVVAAVAGVATFTNLRLNRTGTGYTLSASATGPTSATSTAFNVTPAPASVLVFTVQPSNATAGVTIAPAVQVTARDSVGNTATTFTGTITVAIGTNPSGGTLSGTLAAAAVAGVAGYADLRINRSGAGYTLTAAATGLTTGTSASFTISPAPAVALVFTSQPPDGVAGAALAPSVVVTARDSLGNTATSFISNVTIAIGTNPGGGTLSGTPTVAAVSGVATFANLRINRTGIGYTLTATDAGPTSATSATFNISPAPASVLVFTVQPSSQTAAVAIAPAIQVTARDSVGNTATAFTGNVTLAIGANPGTGTLSGGGPVAAVSGVATFAATSINKSGNGYTLVASATGLASGTSATFNITPGAASVLVFSVQPSAATAGATIAPAVQVTANDNQGNTATAFTGNVTVAIGTNPGGGTLSGTTTVAAAAGVATFATLSINNAGAGYTLTATATGPAGATSAAFTISAGAATQLFFTTQPTAVTAGLAISPAVQVTARDGLGNTATGFTGNVTIAIGTNPSGGAFRPTATTTVAAVAGIANFSNLRLDKAGTGYTLTASAAGAGTASSGAFNITAGPAIRLDFSVDPVTTTAGVAINPAVVIVAQDSLGNTAPTFTGNVSISIDVNPTGGTLSGTTSSAAVAGVATFSNLRITKTGNGYTLLAAAAGQISSGSNAFNIVPGPANLLVFTQQPTSQIAGLAISPAVVVTARDSVGNTATGFTNVVTIAIGANPGSSTLTGTTGVAAVAGVATFADLHLDKTGTGYTLTASATGPTGATSAAFNITPGAASLLVFTVQPTSAVSAVAIAPAVQVTARDNQGNTATSFTGNITVAIGTNAGGGTLSGTAVVAATAGVASFSTLSINLAGTGYTLTANATGVTGATSTTFNITPAAASVLVFTVQPTTATAGAAIAPSVQVTARDPQGNTATSFVGSITVAIGSNPGAGTLSGTSVVAATAGVASFPGLSINKTGTGYTLTAAATGVTGATSSAFNITPGAASVLVFTVQPSSATAGVAIAPAIQVTARDNQGNTATGFTGSVSVAIGTNPGAGTLSGTASLAAVAGVATYTDLEINRTGTGYTLTANATGVTGATSAAFNITPGAAATLVFTVQPVNTTAGVAISPSIQVTARDGQGNTATSFLGNVTVAIGTNPGGGTLTGTNVVAAAAGVATFPGLSINLVGNGYTLTATATGPTAATSNAFNITPGPASVLVFTQQPTTSTAGSNITPTIQVTARDNQGNTATSFTGNITLAIGNNPGGGTLSGTATQTASAGSTSFPGMSINLVGTGYTLTASATGLTTATSAAFNITPAAASVLVFTQQPTSATAGAAITPAVQVTARDNFGNTATAFNGNVTIAIGTNAGGGTLSGTSTLGATAGVVSFAGLSINLAGTGYTLTASSGGLTVGTSAAFNITPGPASVLVFTQQPTSVTAGIAIAPAVQVTARDNQGNTATGFTGTITVAIANNAGGGTLSGTAAVAAAAGVSSFPGLSINLAGTGYTLSATATGPTGATSAAFNITPGPASVLVFTQQPTSATAGVGITPSIQVTARDNQGNTATSFTGTVTLAIGANPGGGTLSGANAVVAISGVATFPGLSINLVGTGYTLTATATGPTSVTSAAFNITPGPASALVFTQQPTSATAGVAITPAVQVTARDNQGNTATSFTGNITVAIGTNPGGGTLSGTSVVAATAGVASFPGLSINKTGTGYTLTATATGPTGATSAAFNITPGAAAVLIFTQEPTSETAGVAITPTIQVTARDNQGNTATGFTGNITIAIGTNAGGGTLSGTNVVAATAGVASFPSLSINLVGTGYTLTAAATGPTSATSAAFNITPGPAVLLVFTQQPTSATAGVGIAPSVQVTARDNQGNTATGFTANVTVAIGTNPGGGTLSGTSVVAATAGVASFPGLNINKAGTGYTLTAAATGLTGATSSAFNITAAAAASIAINAGNGQTATVNTAVAVDPSVIVRDAFSNPVANVSVTFTVIGGGGTIAPASPATVLTDVNGIAALTSWTVGTTAGTNNNTLTAASGTLSGSPLTFTASATPGTANVLVFTQQPTSATAGVAITPSIQVTARDAFANTATGFAGTVTIAIGTNAGGGTLSGTNAVAAAAGVATFPGLSINLVGTGYTLTATATGPTGATSAAFNITPGTASVLVFTQQPTSATSTVAISPAIQVTAHDNQGNTATSFTGNVTIAIGTNAGGGTLSGTNVVAATAGVASFAGLSIDKAGTGYTLAATAVGPTGATSTAFNITAGTAAVLVFTQQPTSSVAGTSITPTVQVTARDAQGNTATGFTANITIAIGTNPGGGTLSGTTVVAATAGVSSFPGISINKSGTGYTLTAAATGPTGATSAAFNITAAAPASIAINAGNGQTATVGTAVAVDPSVIVRDAFSNPVQSVSVTFTVTGGGGTISPASPATISTDANGLATLTSWTLGTTAGTNNNTLSVSSGTLTGSPLTFTATANVGPVSGAQSSVSALPGVITASTGSSASTVTVTVRDQFSNLIQGATVVLTASGTNNTLTQPASTTNASGVATGSLSSTTAETKTVSATANGTLITQNSAVFVQPAAVSAAQSTVVAGPTTIAASSGGTTSTITVTARDQFNNPIQFATVALAATGTNNSLTQPASTTNASGVTTGTLSSTLAETKTVSATISSVAITQQATVTVTAAAASQLVFTQQPTGTAAGADITPPVVVTVRDAFGNTVTGFAGTVTMSIDTDGSILHNAVLSGTNPVTVVNGTATFSDLSINQLGVGYTLKAASGLLSAISAAFTIL